MSESKLINLLTNDPNLYYYNGNTTGGAGNFTQKKIKYGEDRPGSSNSGQPYIVTAIPNRSPFARSVDDGFIRGGATTADRASITAIHDVSSKVFGYANISKLGNSSRNLSFGIEPL